MRYAKVAFEDVTVGDELPRLVKGPIEQIQLTRYAGASGDFNPIHQDEAFARAAGMGGVFAHGMLSMGFVARSEEHTSELQSRLHLVCRLLLEKKKRTASSRTKSVHIN